MVSERRRVPPDVNRWVSSFVVIVADGRNDHVLRTPESRRVSSHWNGALMDTVAWHHGDMSMTLYGWGCEEEFSDPFLDWLGTLETAVLSGVVHDEALEQLLIDSEESVSCEIERDVELRYVWELVAALLDDVVGPRPCVVYCDGSVFDAAGRLLAECEQ